MEKYFIKVVTFIAFVYYKIKDYLILADFNRKHLIIEVEDRKLKVNLFGREEIVEKTLEKISDFRKEEKDIGKIIGFALKAARENCNFIIFHDFQNENKFMQFWTGKGRLEFDFPMYKTNGLKKYKLLILGLLVTLDFADKKYSPSILDKLLYRQVFYGFNIVNEKKGEEYIKANFNKNGPLAAEFIIKVFKDIYKTNPETIKIDLG